MQSDFILSFFMMSVIMLSLVALSFCYAQCRLGDGGKCSLRGI